VLTDMTFVTEIQQ